MRDSFKSIRERLAESQTDFAVRAGLSVSTIGAFESGRDSEFSPGTRRKLATAYGVTIADIDAACSSKPASAQPA
jgi:transcriptional regulator with XRE-family HTH domain